MSRYLARTETPLLRSFLKTSAISTSPASTQSQFFAVGNGRSESRWRTFPCYGSRKQECRQQRPPAQCNTFTLDGQPPHSYKDWKRFDQRISSTYYSTNST